MFKLVPSLHLAKNILASNVKRLPFPYKLTLALTYRCNHKCAICRIWEKTEHGREMTLEDYKNFFSVSNAFSWINITGGEIFLRDDLVELVRTILQNCRRLFLLNFTTNGLLTDDILRQSREIITLKPHKLIVSVSLDGDEKLHDKLRGHKGAWAASLETFKALRQEGIETYFGTTISPWNMDSFHEMVNSVKKRVPWIDYKDFHINFVHYSGHFFDNMDVSEKARTDDKKQNDFINRYLKKKGFMFSHAHIMEFLYLRLMQKYIQLKQTPVLCQSLSASCYVDPRGEVYPCTIFDKKIGNLRDYGFSLSKLWQENHVKSLRAEIMKRNCPNCWTPCEAYQSIFGSVFQSVQDCTSSGAIKETRPEGVFAGRRC